MEWIASLLTLTAMEIVLGIDNILFLSILVSGLPHEMQANARFIGLSIALVARVGLLLSIRWVMELDVVLFRWSNLGFLPDAVTKAHGVDAVTGRDLVLLAGGLFLIAKAVLEIHKKAAGEHDEVTKPNVTASFAFVLAQIVAIDLVFSLDSVISAIGMARETWIMIVAMLVAVGFMGIFSKKVSAFIDRNPTFKMLALAFLVMIGALLVAEGLGTHVNKGYIYAAMIFALGVEVLNMRARKHTGPAKPAEATAETPALERPPPSGVE